MINDKPNLSFAQQDVLILQLQASLNTLAHLNR